MVGTLELAADRLVGQTGSKTHLVWVNECVVPKERSGRANSYIREWPRVKRYIQSLHPVLDGGANPLAHYDTRSIGGGVSAKKTFISLRKVRYQSPDYERNGAAAVFGVWFFFFFSKAKMNGCCGFITYVCTYLQVPPHRIYPGFYPFADYG